MSVIESVARIRGQDATGKTFDAIAKKIEGVAKGMKQLQGIKPPTGAKAGAWGDAFDKEVERLKVSARELAAIQKSWESFNRALMKNGPMKAGRFFDAQEAWKTRTLANLRELRSGFDETERAHRRFFRGAGRFAIQAAGVGAAGYVANRAVRQISQAGIAGNRQQTLDWQSGLTPEESKAVGARASELSAKYPSLTGTTLHEQLRDFQMSVGDLKKMEVVSETIAQGAVVLQSMKGKDQGIEEARKFFKALDVLGKNVDPKDVKELYTGFVKAMGVEGAEMNMGDVAQLAKKSRAAGSALSNRFMFTSGAALMQDLGAQETGTALASGLSQNIAGRATKSSKAMQQAYGLRDKNGNFVNKQQYLSDPDQWAWNTLKPALLRKGIDTNNEVAVAEAISKLFSNRTVSDIFNKLITQESQYRRKGEEQYPKAKGPEDARELAQRDAGVAIEGIKSQLVNFAAQTTPLFDAMAPKIAAFAENLGKMNEAIKSGNINKEGAAMLGGGALGLGGLGIWATKQAMDALMSPLTAPAAHLEVAAVALERAAIKIGGGQSVNSAMDAASKGAPAPGAKPSIWSRLGGAVKGAPVAAVPFLTGAAAAPALFGAAFVAALYDETTEAGTRGMTGSQAARKRGGGTVNDALRRMYGDNGLPVAPQVPLVSPTMTYGMGVGGDRHLDVKGEVEGEVTVKNVIEAGSELLRVVQETRDLQAELRGQLRSMNGPGSTGVSSPDARPSSTGVQGPR